MRHEDSAFLPITADSKHCTGRQTVCRAGGFDRYAHAFFGQRALKYGAFHILDAQIEDMRHGVLRTVDMHRGIRRKCLPKPFAVALNDRTAALTLIACQLQCQRR